MSNLRNKPLIRVARKGGNRGHGWDRRKPHAWYATSLANVTRVSQEVRRLLGRNTEKELRTEVRVSHQFYDDIIKLQDCLDMTEGGDEATLEALEAARDTVLLASEDFQKLPDANQFVRTAAVAKLSAIRGLETKEQIQEYLKDVDVVVNWRLGRSEHAQTVKDEGYTDANGKEYLPADLAEKAERGRQRDAEPGGRAVALASRTSTGGHGLQNEEANKESMRRQQDRSVRARQRNPHRQRDAVDAEHKERNAPPPPQGAKRSVGGYVARDYLVPPDELNPATWDRAEIERRVAEFRERLGVPEIDPNVYGTYVRPDGDGYTVKPPERLWRRARVKTRLLYYPKTRSFIFPEKDEAVTAYEKFMAPSTSDVERKKMLTVPPEAKICAYCDHKPFGRIVDRVLHEKYYCKSRPGVQSSSSSSSSSSEEDEPEEEEEEESEVDEPEEVVAQPPKRARFLGFKLW